jgi:hypothetical protein
MATLDEWLNNLRDFFAEKVSNSTAFHENQFTWLRDLNCQISQWESRSCTQDPHTIPADILQSAPVSTTEIKSVEEIASVSALQEVPVPTFATYDPDHRSTASFLSCELIASNPGVRFVADESLLQNESDSDSICDEDDDAEHRSPIPFTVADSAPELTQTASSFRDHWHEMVRMKEAERLRIQMRPAVLAFDDNDEQIVDGYQISDDSDQEDPYDDIYERNPVEIHGKMIPFWARGDQLLKQLRRQKRI